MKFDSLDYLLLAIALLLFNVALAIQSCEVFFIAFGLLILTCIAVMARSFYPDDHGTIEHEEQRHDMD